MTVADNTSRNQYTATPSQALFAYTFEIVDKDDIVVLINGTPLSEGTDYTVTGVGSDTGGNIVLTSGTTGGNIVTIYRDMPYSRTQNYTNSGDFLASEVNSDFDNLWLAGEQTNRAFSQSIRKPITDSDSISMELPEAASRASKFLKFDANGAVDLAAGVTTDVDADDVSIADAGGYYTSDNVEGALQEIGAQPPGFDPNTDSFNIGSDAVSSGADSIALGHDASATAARDIALGFDAVASGGGSIAIGQETDSTGVRSIAIGKGAQSTFSTSIALGENASTLGGAGGSPVAIGYNASSTGTSGISLGPNTTASGSQSISIGDSVSATGSGSTALGHDASATGDKSIAIGFESYASFVDAIAIGTDTRSDALGSIAIGTGSDASQLGSVALGKGAQATGAGATIAIGEAATTSGGLASPIAIGYQANTTGAYGVGLGYQTVTSGAQSIAIGYIASATNDNSIAIGRQLTVAGQKAVGIGWGAVAGSYDSIGIGTSANALTTDCISIGASSSSLATGGIAIGNGASISAGNIKGVAVGYAAQAQQIGGVAVGNNAICNSQFGTALGRDSNASSGSYATALGYGSVASDYATAINNSDATGARSVAIGHSAVSSSADSIAIGYNADALGTDSIAIGNIAGADAENTIHINASGVDTNQPQTAGYIVIETDDASLKYDGSWSLTGGPLNLSGGIDVGGDVAFGDNDKAIFGAGSDLQVYHSGSSSFITDVGTGDLRIRSNKIRMEAPDSQNMIIVTEDAGLQAFYNGTQRLEVTNTGIDVTGVITTDGMTTSADINFGDNDKAVFGAGSDLQIYHTGSNSFIQDTGVGDLYLATNGDKIILRNTTLGESFFEGTSNGDAKIFYNGLEKLATTSTGIDVTGTVTADGLAVEAATPVIEIDSTTSANLATLQFATSGAVDSKITHQASTGVMTIDSGRNSSWGGKIDFVTDTDTRMRISNNGDVSLYEDTGTTAKFFWDAAAERLGLGTDSPDASLEVNSGGGIHLSDHTAGRTLIIKPSLTGGTHEFTSDNTSAGYSFSNNSSELMRIDSSGNVGIGTDSPDADLHIEGSAPYLRTKNTSAPTDEKTWDYNAGTDGSFRFRATNDAGTDSNNWMVVDRSGVDINYIAMSTGNQDEAMRISSSGKLLVGTTYASLFDTSTQANAGALIDGVNDNVQIARWQGVPLYLNRMSTDGTVADFRRDGTSVGSIQSRAGLVTSIILDPRTDGAGLTGTTNTIEPVDGTGTRVDNTINLASSAYRFKDLHLSGGAYLGGTAAANKLDDYEEGTWTPIDSSGAALTLTNVVGNYTKVGRAVTVTGYVEIPTTVTTNAVKIGGLPFQSLNSTARSAGGIGYTQSVEAASIMIDGNTTICSVYQSAGTTTKNNHLSGEVFYFGFTYFVS